MTSSKEEIAIGPQLPPGYVVQSTVEEDEHLKNSSDNQSNKNGCVDNVSASIEPQAKPSKENLVLGDIPPKRISEKLEKQTDQTEEGPQPNKEIIANLQR